MAALGALAAGVMRLLAEHRGEDIVEVLLAVALFVGVLLAVELRIVAVLPKLVIFGATLIVFENFPCFGEIFEFCFGFFADVGVIFTSQTAIGGLDGFQIVRWLNPQNGIIIL